MTGSAHYVRSSIWTHLATLSFERKNNKYYFKLTFELACGLISVLKKSTKKFMNPQKISVIEPNEKGLDSKTLPSLVMYAIVAVSQGFLEIEAGQLVILLRLRHRENTTLIPTLFDR